MGAHLSWPSCCRAATARKSGLLRPPRRTCHQQLRQVLGQALEAFGQRGSLPIWASKQQRLHRLHVVAPNAQARAARLLAVPGPLAARKRARVAAREPAQQHCRRRGAGGRACVRRPPASCSRGAPVQRIAHCWPRRRRRSPHAGAALRGRARAGREPRTRGALRRLAAPGVQLGWGAICRHSKQASSAAARDNRACMAWPSMEEGGTTRTAGWWSRAPEEARHGTQGKASPADRLPPPSRRGSWAHRAAASPGSAPRSCCRASTCLVCGKKGRQGGPGQSRGGAPRVGAAPRCLAPRRPSEASARPAWLQALLPALTRPWAPGGQRGEQSRPLPACPVAHGPPLVPRDLPGATPVAR